MEAYVNYTKSGSVGEIDFFHPSHNALPGAVLADLTAAIEQAGQDSDTHVIVLKSGGNRTFCAGASFNELVAISTPEEGQRFFMGFANVINAMRKCPKFIIGRVQGKTVGGGVGLASATDYCLATQYASVKLSELNVGIGPFVVGPAVSRKVGVSAMSQLAINADAFFSAEWAKQKGLFAEVYESSEAMDEAVNALASKLCTYNIEAMREMKAMFWEGTEHWDDLLKQRAAISGRLVLSDFTKETLKRFK